MSRRPRRKAYLTLGRCGICWRAASSAGPLCNIIPREHAAKPRVYFRFTSSWSSPRPSGWRASSRVATFCPAHAAFSRRDRPLRVGAGAAVRVCLIRWAAGCSAGPTESGGDDAAWRNRVFATTPSFLPVSLHSASRAALIVALAGDDDVRDAVLLRERWGWLRIVGVATSLFGVTLAVTRASLAQPFGEAAGLGGLYIFIAVASWVASR